MIKIISSLGVTNIIVSNVIVKTDTETGVISATRTLSNDERTEEIARMLAGETITAEARAAAVALLGD